MTQNQFAQSMTNIACPERFDSAPHSACPFIPSAFGRSRFLFAGLVSGVSF